MDGGKKKGTIKLGERTGRGREKRSATVFIIGCYIGEYHVVNMISHLYNSAIYQCMAKKMPGVANHSL